MSLNSLIYLDCGSSTFWFLRKARIIVLMKLVSNARSISHCCGQQVEIQNAFIILHCGALAPFLAELHTPSKI
jgi:hypothetical protein